MSVTTVDSVVRLGHPGEQFAWANRAVLLVDIVKSVRLVEQDEVNVIARWFSFTEDVRTQVLPQYGGRLVKSLGDGMLLDFDDVRFAVAAAFAIQRISKANSSAYPPEQQILLRMGMEVSDVIVAFNDVHGRGVNLAARLMTLAGPGEIVISQHVRDRLTSTLDAEIEDLGDCFLRHVKEPVRAYRIGPPGSHALIKSAMVSLEELAPAIAVIPFASQHARDDHDVIGEVLAEDIIRALSRSPDLNVISRLSTTAFRGRSASLEEIGNRLHADYVLSGAYTSDEQNVTIEVELAETRTGRIIWSERLKERVSAILSDEQELIDRLVAGICAGVMTRELQRARLQPLPTLKAYTLLIGAIAIMHRLSLRDFEESRRLLQALVERGAQPIGLAWLANWHVLRVQQGWSDDQGQDAQRALEYIKRALDADPDCSLAFAIDGFVHANLLKKLDIAKERYESALAANPSNSLAWLLKGTLHAFKSEGREAVDHTQRALKLSPLDPRHYFYDSLAATAFVADHQYERAMELAQRSLRANRKHTSTLRVLTVAQWNLGLFDEARATVKELMGLEPSLTVSGWLERHPAAAYPIGRETSEVLRQAGVPN